MRKCTHKLRLPSAAAVVAVMSIAPCATDEAWRVHVEDITDVGVFEGNTPAIWGYHQSLIVRTGDSVFAAIMAPRGDGFQQQWSLFERTAEDSWTYYVLVDAGEITDSSTMEEMK